MQSNSTNLITTNPNDPLLVAEVNESSHDDRGDGRQTRKQQRWFDKIIDVGEAKNLGVIAVPMILTNVFYYMIPVISMMFVGHLGELEFAASNLATSWASVTGFAFMIGLSGALETLCGQGYGADQYRMMGIYLQASCIISLVFSILVSVLWWYSDTVLIFLHQDPQISKAAGLYLKNLIPGLFAFGIMENILRFFQTQSVVMPLVICSALPLIIHIGITYALVHWTTFAFAGAAISISISYWVSVLVLGLYVFHASVFSDTWDGFAMESFYYVVTNLKLALPNAAMVCLECWAFELLVLLAGLMPNPEITTSLIAMCVDTEGFAFMLTYGLSAAASTRVSNELGAGDSKKAKHALMVSLKLCGVLAVAVVMILGIGHDIWAGFFSDSPVIVKEFAYMTPLLVISILFDFFQGILSGVARGCGWQHLAVVINLGTFYFIGMVIACFLGFKLKLYAKGLWIGLICGLFCQACGMLLLSWFIKWKRVELSTDRDYSIQQIH